MSSPASFANTSVPSSPVDLLVELLEDDEFDKVIRGLRSKLEFAGRDSPKLLAALVETRKKLEDLEATHEKVVEANEALTRRLEEMERQRKEWAIISTKSSKRHIEHEVAKGELEAKYSITLAELCEMDELYGKAEKEIAELKDQIVALSSPTPDTLKPHKTRHGSWSPHLNGYDECIVLSVEGQCFYVSRRLLQRNSQYFEDLLEVREDSGDMCIGETDANPIVVDEVTAEEMIDFLTLLHAPLFENDFDHIDIRQWAAILKLANLWSFKAIKAYAIAVFETRFVDEDCFDRLERAFTCGVSKWVRPAYDDMCRRPEPLTANEGRQLGWDRYAAICCIREQLARGTLDSPMEGYEYLSNFSDNFPTFQPSSVEGSPVPSAIVITTEESSISDEAEPVSQDVPNDTSGALQAEREYDIPINTTQRRDLTPVVAHNREPITAALHTPDDHGYTETEEAHSSNDDEASQASPQQHDPDCVAAANALYLLGDEHQFHNRYDKALEAFGAALRLYRELDDRPRVARCLRMIGECHNHKWRCDKAREAYTDASKAYGELGDRREVAQCHHMVGECRRKEGRYMEARTGYCEALELYREMDDRLEVARNLHMIGEVERIQGQYEAGVTAYTEAYKHFLELGDLLDVAKNLSMIGECKRLVPGLSKEAPAAFREASKYYQKVHNRRGAARCMQMVGECHREEGRYEEAQDAYKEASEAYERSGHQLGVGHCLSMITECRRAQGHVGV
ncbi:hypothetical protein FRB94_012216 [Tulasnella sp. JGI-2019a]|nr:hypothetical protein FRB93_005226 [Tulasnella sp. JGI-2019a]KAG8991848.1 hypothetical protein FRB94_012216 [Tulasnella sp. JGI-2019a]